MATFNAALERVRLAYARGLAGADPYPKANQYSAETAGYGSPHEEAAERLGLRDRARTAPPRRDRRESGVR